MRWLGVDVGGTFTDLVLYDEATGQLEAIKTPSTPHDQSEGILIGIDRLGLALPEVAKIAHGTTVATNTALERDGARLAVVTTEGHRDVLIVGRGNRTSLYNIRATRPPSLVRRTDIHEVAERSLHDGTILHPLDEMGLRRVAESLAATDVEAVAVCFLHSYANPENERRAVAILREALPQVQVTSSSEVLPEYREYERFATTALNAYVAPKMRRYLGNLRRRLATRGYAEPVALMTSNGGTQPAEAIERLPVTSMLSGPAAGVIGARHLGAVAGFPDIVTYDMGGTSTDVCLLNGGVFDVTTEAWVGHLPNKVLQIDINSIGAGGGSIADADAHGFLSVGPRSAGARPGPACYGHGGTEATVSDANLVLGRLAAGETLGGAVTLDLAAAERAIDALGVRLGLARLAAADGIIRVAVAKMTGAIKEISIMRGRDPRDYALFAYGGAGPLHAAFIAAELDMKEVIVPLNPGNFSAFGLLVADTRRDFVRTQIVATETLGLTALTALLEELQHRAVAEMGAAGFAEAALRFEASLDMRYIGQAFELSVPIPLAPPDLATVESAFRAVYERRYAYAPDAPTEIISLRLAAFASGPKPEIRRLDPAGRSWDAALRGRRMVAFDARLREVPVVDRASLPIEEPRSGPMIVEESGSSTIVPPGFSARLEPFGSLILKRA